MTLPKYLQFHLLPYLPLKDDLQFGKVLLWSFYRKRDEYLADELIRKQMQRYVERYVDDPVKCEPVKCVMIASYNSPDYLEPLTREQLEEMENAVHSLCFCSLLEKFPLFSVSSDNFQLLRQNFVPGDQGIAISSGSWIRSKESGMAVDEVLFVKPRYVRLPLQVCFDEKLLTALEESQKDESNTTFHRRVMRALEWVGYAYTNVDGFSYFSRIVMMATAFEILLDGFKGRPGFVDKIEGLVCFQREDTEVRSVVTKKGCHDEEHTLKGWWASEFYELRSRVVHGNRLADDDANNSKGQKYFSLAVEFFAECLRKILNEQRYYSYDDKNEILWAGIYERI